jgi:hypothetical protein
VYDAKSARRIRQSHWSEGCAPQAKPLFPWLFGLARRRNIPIGPTLCCKHDKRQMLSTWLTVFFSDFGPAYGIWDEPRRPMYSLVT